MKTTKTNHPDVLFVTSEIHPLTKTGGLADVSAALPAALYRLGVDIRVLVPGYDRILEGALDKSTLVRLNTIPGVGEIHLVSARMPETGVPLIIIDYPAYFSRPAGPYVDASGHDWPDNAQRFGLLSRIAALLGGPNSPLKWRPEIVHCNDWQSGLAPALLHYADGPKAATVMTIHNLAYQGIFPADLVTRMGLPPESFSMHGVEYYGSLSFLKAGLFYADHITTVSPTYAREIQSEALGFGMQGLLAQRRDELTGIINGVELEHWNPAHDPHIASTYTQRQLEKKRPNKLALQRAYGLPESAEIPLLGIVSRITEQKGLDLVLATAEQMVARPAQMVLLGTGEKTMEQAFRDLAARFPEHVGINIGFDESLSHLVEAGADIFLMPSRFEPCGLNQMYSMLYGTPPVVHGTGGLADTVIDVNSETIANGSATGFVFHGAEPHAFLGAVDRAIAAYEDKQLWHKLQVNGMGRDFSWNKSAQDYLALYAKVLEQRLVPA